MTSGHASTTSSFKRFYTAVTVVEERQARDVQYQVLLDGRPVKTPRREPLRAPTRALAQAIAGEWDRQADLVDLGRMPLTRLANVVIDQTPTARAGLASQLRQYAATDCVCYLEQTDDVLRARQHEAWSPLRAWASDELGVHLVPVDGIMPAPQPEESLDAVVAIAAQMDDWRLTGACHAAALLASTVLALAMVHGRVSGEQAFAISRVDEAHQQERWGIDEEAAASADSLKADLLAMDAWFRALD